MTGHRAESSASAPRAVRAALILAGAWALALAGRPAPASARPAPSRAHRPMAAHADAHRAGDAPARPSADQAACKIFEIKATNEPGGVDPALRPLARKLKKPPFSSWKTFRLLKRHDQVLQRMKQLDLKLVTGSRMGLLYREKSGGKQTKVRLRLSFTLDDKHGKRKLDGTINVDSGDYYLIGGDEVEGGTYIVAVSCTAK